LSSFDLTANWFMFSVNIADLTLCDNLTVTIVIFNLETASLQKSSNHLYCFFGQQNVSILHPKDSKLSINCAS